MRHPRLLEILDSLLFLANGGELFLYGSQVRGDATEESDIDLMVFDPKLYHSLLPSTAALEQAYGVPIQLQYGKRNEFTNSKSAFWRSLRSQAVSVDSFLSEHSSW